MFRFWGATTVIVTFCLAQPAPAQDNAPPPTARELFYQAASTPKPSVKSTPTPAVKRTTTPTPQATAAATPPSTPPPVRTAPGGASGTEVSMPVHIIKASAETGPPLGLRYSIVRLVEGRMVEVSPDYVFHSGDHLQLKVQTNAPGYLYVVSQGSSGTWTPLFPSPKIANGDNRVDGFHTYTLPTPEYQISFDYHTGTENMTVVFSRQPVADFEDLIYSLQGKQAQPAPAANPAGDSMPAPRPKGTIMMASVRIDDSVVGRLRGAASRDLIVEHVDSATPADTSKADQKETAVYVVNPAGSPDSRLVADLHLVHK